MRPISGLGLIVIIRAEQIFKHGRTIASDSNYYSRDVFQRAAVAIIHSNIKEWPEMDIPLTVFRHIISKERREQYAHAASFIAAAIDYVEYGQVVAAIAREEMPANRGEAWLGHATNEIKDLSLSLDIAGKHKTVLPKSVPVFGQVEQGCEFDESATIGSSCSKDAGCRDDIQTERHPAFINANYQSLLKTNMEALGHIINATITGDARNTLCDIMIHLQYMLKLLGNDNHTTKTVNNMGKV